MIARLVAFLTVALCASGAAGVIWIHAAAGGGVSGTNFLDDADCIGAYLMTSAGTQAGHENNACTQVSNPAPDVAWQGTGANWTNSTPAGTAAGQDAVDIDRDGQASGVEYFKGEGTAGEFDMMGSTKLTFMCWMNLDESANNKPFISRQGSANFALKQAFQEARVEIAGTLLTSTALSQTLGEWHHWASVYDSAATGAEMELWVDGLSEGTGSQLTTPNVANIDFGIGANQAGAGDFDGQLMECGVFDRVMTDTEICEVVLCGLDGTADGAIRDTNFGATGCTCSDIATCC